MKARNLGILALVLIVIGVLCLLGFSLNLLNFGLETGEDFFEEQNPQAESLGEAIGMQYSQLRELGTSLDDVACRIDNVGTLYSEFQEIYSGEGSEANWPENAQEEARNYRTELGALRQTYSRIAADYNVLRTDIRTIVDNLGLEVDDIPRANALSPDGVCGDFELPDMDDLENPD